MQPMTTLRMYGIPNCDTIKKAKTWLTDQGVEFDFHNYKKDGISEDKIRQWLKAVSWEELLNRRGTTWRKLDDSVKDNIDEQSAIQLMIEQPSIIKRPVLETDKKVLVGFKPDDYQQALN